MVKSAGEEKARKSGLPRAEKRRRMRRKCIQLTADAPQCISSPSFSSSRQKKASFEILMKLRDEEKHHGESLQPAAEKHAQRGNIKRINSATEYIKLHLTTRPARSQSALPQKIRIDPFLCHS